MVVMVAAALSVTAQLAVMGNLLQRHVIRHGEVGVEVGQTQLTAQLGRFCHVWEQLMLLCDSHLIFQIGLV